MRFKAYESVQITCDKCKSTYDTVLRQVEDSNEDYCIECLKCENWESGSLPLQGFSDMKYIE